MRIDLKEDLGFEVLIQALAVPVSIWREDELPKEIMELEPSNDPPVPNLPEAPKVTALGSPAFEFPLLSIMEPGPVVPADSLRCHSPTLPFMRLALMSEYTEFVSEFPPPINSLRNGRVAVQAIPLKL